MCPETAPSRRDGSLTRPSGHNSALKPHHKIWIDNNSLRLNVGTGCNITSDWFANTNPDETAVDYVQAGRAAFTDENYRRFTANPVYNGWDYDYLVAEAGLVH